jgi:hypothetical protein
MFITGPWRLRSLVPKIDKLGNGMGLYFKNLDLEPHGVAIFAYDGNVASYDAGIGAHRCKY